MTVRPEALRVARRWVAKAEEDLAAAERLLSLDDSLASVVCFHSQQAATR
jgi:HEPN domain-containing protein